MSQDDVKDYSAEWAFLEAVYNSAEIGICVTDQHRRFVRVNDAYCETYGYTRDELLGEPFTHVLPEAWRETAARMHDAFIAGGDESAGEWQVLRKDGSVRDVMVTAGRVVTPDGQRYKVTTVTDITQRKAVEGSLRETEQQLRSLIENFPGGVLFEDGDRRVHLVNQHFIDLLTLPTSPAQFVGTDCRVGAQAIKDRFDDPERFIETIESRINGGQPAVDERIGMRDGRILRREYVPVRSTDSGPNGHLWLYRDITEQTRLSDRLEQMAHFDALTGLPNRSLLTEELDEALGQTDTGSALIAVAYIDLDAFKAINDTQGHTRGDWTLTVLAERMQSALRPEDILARVGGDEFIAVINGVTAREDAEGLIEAMHEVAVTSTDESGAPVPITASIGVTFYPQTESLQAAQLIRQADQAMYAAKRAGKNQIVYFDPEQDHAIRGHHEQVDAVRRALRAGDLLLHYQPKVDMRTGAVIGAEALIRWNHPERGLLSPGAFLPSLAGTGAAIELGDWVLETAARQVVAWRRQGYTIPVSINVDGHQIAQPDFVDKLTACLERHPDLRAGDLELEVLESSALDDIDRVRAVIDACATHGIGFALDDFGTGYSTLNYLKHLPAPVLKIDQSFVRDMLDDADDLAILDGIQSLAKAFRRQTVAEGVETFDHGSMLLALGCDVAQGYGIARPMAPSAMPVWVDTWRPPEQWRAGTRVHQDDISALFAVVDHRNWLQQLAKALFEGGEAPSLQPHDRRLGQWLRDNIIPISRASLTRTDRQRRLTLNRIHELHQTVYADAATLLTLEASAGQVQWRVLCERSEAMIELMFDVLNQTPGVAAPAPLGPRFPASDRHD